GRARARGRQPAPHARRRRHGRRGGGMPLAARGARAGRARDEGRARGQGPERRRRALRARRPRSPRRAARERPPRRRADDRPHRSREPQAGARSAPAATDIRVMRLAVAATAPIGADVLERLSTKFDIAYLVSRPDAPRGRGRKLAPPPAKLTAERLGITVHQPERPALPEP